MPDLRHFHRITFAVTTDVVCNGTESQATLVDISLKGALIRCQPGFVPELGSSCRLTIHLNNTDVMFSFSGEVVHVTDDLAGIKISLIDLDSMIHLRRLVTLNSENSAQVNRELHALFDFGNDHG